MADVKDGGAAKREIGFDIPTVDGHVATVSSEDYARLQGIRWRLGSNGYVYKVGARKKGEQCLMHRIVMNAKPGEEIHHGALGKLNNMRSNLELTTPSAHQEHHKSVLIERNRSKRIYPATGNCKWCGVHFEKDPNHRGRQVCCSKSCSMQLGERVLEVWRAATRKQKAHTRRMADALIEEEGKS